MTRKPRIRISPSLLFGRGARGEIIRRLQVQLTAAGFSTNGRDGIYGNGTVGAVKAFQKANGLTVTGSVDDKTWVLSMKAPVPPLLDRCLGLTATFEGHGFTLAQGNFDGAGLTWGIIGFTLKHGELKRIIKAAFTEDPELVRSCFGDKTDELLKILEKPLDQQIAWADSISIPPSKAPLQEPWKSAFTKFGNTPLAQRLQLERVRDAYFEPAIRTAQRFGIVSEIGIALCFDIHVQNGSVKPAAEASVRRKLQPGMAPVEIRLLLADAVADNALPRWREDVRERKSAIARGAGVVHGLRVELPNWGLDEFDVVSIKG